ncbi:MAG: DUF4209 domain-containing protein [Nitrospirae bacterium]|nr:DUF4209 domain-containing protein [Nitrospirota bacterium]
MSERIKLSDVTRIEDISRLERNDEVEGILNRVYGFNDFQVEHMVPQAVINIVNGLDDANIAVLENSLQTLQTDVGKVFLHITLWLRLKKNGANHFREAIRLLSGYFGTFNNIKGEPNIDKILHLIFYFSHYFLKDAQSIKELSDFVTTYENNIEKLIDEISMPKVDVSPFFLLTPLQTYYCFEKFTYNGKNRFKKIIELLLDNYIGIKEHPWAMNVLTTFEKCFEKDEYIILKRRVAKLHLDIGLEYRGLKARNLLIIAASMFQQVQDHKSMDEALGAIKKKEQTIDWEVTEVPLQIEVLDQLIARHLMILEELFKKWIPCVSLLDLLFNNNMLPSKVDIENSKLDTIIYRITTVLSMTEGRSCIVTTEEEEEEHKKAGAINRCLFFLHIHIINRVIEWFIEKYEIEGFKERLKYIYQESTVYERIRETIIVDVIGKYLNDDIFGFVYSVIPQIEYFLKLLLVHKGLSVTERKLNCIEEITLTTILAKHKPVLIDILGKNFYEVLWLCFQSQFGLNVRNSVMHGRGLTFMCKEYATLLFFIFGFIMFSAYKENINKMAPPEGQ